jgi:hypothetical protein
VLAARLSATALLSLSLVSRSNKPANRLQMVGWESVCLARVPLQLAKTALYLKIPSISISL